MCFLFSLLSEQGMREWESISQDKLSWERKRKLLPCTSREVHLKHFSPQPCSWQLLHCFYEIQEEFLTQVIAHFQGRRLYVQNDMKLLMLTFYFKSRCCMKRLQLNESGQHRQAQRPHTVVLWVIPPPLSPSPLLVLPSWTLEAPSLNSH